MAANDTTDTYDEYTTVTVDWFAENPLITPGSGDRIGRNINGPSVIRAPEWEYEGRDRPLETSRHGSADEPVKELRDPTVFEEDGSVFLFYTVAGECGIAGGELR